MANKVNVFSNVDAGMLPSLEALCLRSGGRHLAHPQPDGSFTVTCTLPETIPAGGLAGPGGASGASGGASAGTPAGGPVPIQPAPTQPVDGQAGAGAVVVVPMGAGGAGGVAGPIPGPVAGPVTIAIAGGPAEPAHDVAGMIRIDVTPTDLDALQRVANSEVGHFGKYGEDQLRGGLGAVVDTIFNRVAHPKFPKTIVGVVNQRAQFSAINPLGTWARLPQAPAAVAQIVADHVRDRAAGKPSEIDGATHFLNPHISSASAMAEWGQFLVNNVIKIYGNDAKRDVHYHGFPPGGTLPPPYIVSFAGQAALFDESGRLPVAGGSNEALRRRIVEAAEGELERFRKGQAKETDDPQFLRVGDYWRVVGSANNGRTTGSDGKRPAWSAAFVSFVLREAGAAARFPAAPGHFKYFQHFVDNPGRGLYEARLVADVTPKPGDILHYGREHAANFDFEAARRATADDGFYPSHGDIVVAVDLDAKKVTTIGGNVSNSVKEKTYALDEQGRLKPRKEGSKTLPWIGILQLV
jgi:hypothetical protein